MYKYKRYTRKQWEFIEEFELADPTYAKFMTEYDEHQRNLGKLDYGMTRKHIQRVEQDYGDGRQVSAYDAWRRFDLYFEIQRNDLPHSLGLRKRSEAAWRARPIARAREAFRSFLRELYLPK